MRSTVAGLMESLAVHLQLTSDSKALINAFRQNGQGNSEEVRSYIFRKQQESQTIMRDGYYDKREMVETGFRGMREEEALKHRLLRKFGESRIKNFDQLESQVETEPLEYKGVSSIQPIEQISYTTGDFRPAQTRQQQRRYQ